MCKWRANRDGKAWDFWHGTWSSASPGKDKAPWRGQGQTSQAGIPAFDAPRGSQAGGQPEPAAAGQPHTDAGLLQALQKAVNSARKTEQRVKKLTQERQTKSQQWRDWEADLRKTYAKEKARYKAALEKNEMEMQQALQAQASARMAVREIACGAQEESGRQEVQDVDMEFEELIGGASQDPWEDTDEVLRRALAETMALTPHFGEAAALPARVVTPNRPTGAAPRTPALQGISHTQSMVKAPSVLAANTMVRASSSRLTPFPPPLQSTQDLSNAGGQDRQLLGTDPYVFGAGEEPNAKADQATAATSLSPVNGPPKTPRSRQFIKDTAKPTKPLKTASTGPSRAELLDQKRSAAIHSLGTEAASAVALSNAHSQEHVPHFVLNYDDEDQGAGTPPGINNVMD